MLALFKTELWLSKAGQVAQSDPDYSQKEGLGVFWAA